MKVANIVKISVFAKEHEDMDKIRQALLSLFPFDLREEKIAYSEKNAQGFSEKKIKVFDILLEKNRHCNAFLEKLFSRFSAEQIKMLREQLDKRIDDECNLFIRLDKNRLLNNEYFVVYSGNCFHIKISIAAFPSRKDIALKVMDEYLSSMQ